ncbi:hypothetical protein HDU98_004499 [Podochytrium sp. JEL0797]|nr:hypothetical protein HDU98_004499 [Podochytrium sp. JEL0797]
MTESQTEVLSEEMKLKALELVTYFHELSPVVDALQLQWELKQRESRDAALRQLQILPSGLGMLRDCFMEKLARSEDEHPYHRAIAFLIAFKCNDHLRRPVPGLLYSAISLFKPLCDSNTHLSVWKSLRKIPIHYAVTSWMQSTEQLIPQFDDAAARYPGHYCSECRTKRVDSETPFKKFSQRESQFNCSVKCQTIGWDGHKEYCRAVGEFYVGDVVILGNTL